MTWTLAQLADQAAPLGGWRVGLLAAPIAWAAATVFVGLWLMLPRARRWPRWPAGLVMLAGLIWFGAELGRLADPVGNGLFVVLAAVTLTGCLATVTSRNPVYSAIWFAQALLGVAGLMLLQGAQFLGMATVVVYVGAIVVTLLFVLMLARPDGRAVYDRQSWEPLLAVVAGAVLVGMLSIVLVRALPVSRAADPLEAMQAAEPQGGAGVLAAEHTARLGAQLFGRHLVAVDVTGVLLLAALVGAAAITQRGRQMTKSEIRSPNSGDREASGSVAAPRRTAGE
jgi:NADH-quinone oxidoreductase subunit J